MLIVEGPDGSGKSTLVRRLSGDLSMPISPRVVQSDTTAMVDLARWTEDNVARGFQRMLFDRHRLISEPIYGPVLRGRQNAHFINHGWLSQMMWQFYAAEPIIIYCLPDIRTIWRNVKKPETENQVVAQVGVVEALYTGYITRATLDMARGVSKLYNYETSLYEDLLRWVKFRLEAQNDRAGHLPRTVPLPAATA